MDGVKKGDRVRVGGVVHLIGYADGEMFRISCATTYRGQRTLSRENQNTTCMVCIAGGA